MKKILLTGASGFVGRNILEQLGYSYNFVYPGHKELDLLNARAVREYLAVQKFDVVIHAAGTGVLRDKDGIVDIFENNKKMFLSVAENAKLYGRLIFLGSGAEYGKQNSLVKVKESDFGTVLPANDYGKAKYFASEQIAKMDNALSLRCFGVFGKYEDYATRFISNAICRALFNLPIVIRQNVVFDYIYVSDLIEIINYFIGYSPKQKFYNAGSGEGIELLTLAKIVQSKTGGKSEIIIKTSGLGKEYTCNNSLLLSEIKNFHFTPFEESIGELVNWYKENLHSIKQQDLNFDAN